MKKIIFIIFILPLTAFAQLGIKAGYIKSGLQAGINYQFNLDKTNTGFIEIEGLLNAQSYNKTGYFIDNAGLIKEYEEKGINYSISTPITFKIQRNKNFSPLFRCGLNPTIGKINTIDFLLGTGIKLHRFCLDGRVLLPILEKEKVYFTASIGYFFW